MFCLLLYVFDMFHILLSGDSLRDLWNVCVCVCVCVRVSTDGEENKNSLTCSMRGKRSVKKAYFRVLCVHACTCVCGKVGSVHALVDMILWLYTVNLFWCDI